MRRLPPQPSLEHLKKEAKELLRRLRRGEADDDRIQRWLPPMNIDGDPGGRWTLGVVQQALAMSYGFTSWATLKGYIEAAGGRASGDFPPEVITQWQQLVDTVAGLLDVPAALLRRLDGDEIETLVAADVKDAPISVGERARLAGQYCERVVREGGGLQQIAQAGADAPPGSEFASYLGYPVRYPWGEVFGTLCVLDHRPRTFSANEEGLLVQLVSLVEAQLALMHQANLLSWRNDQLEGLLVERRRIRSLVRMCSHCRKVADAEAWVPIEEFMGKAGLAFTHGICPSCFEAHYEGGEEE